MRQPFFVVGAGRSGTTYLYNLLKAHPRVALTNEAHLIYFLSICFEIGRIEPGKPTRLVTPDGEYALEGLVNGEYRVHFGQIFEEAAARMLERFYAETFPDRDFTHWGDKMPSTPPTVIQNVMGHFPEARFVAPIRDPRGFVCSYRGFVDRAGVGASFGSVAECAEHWKAQYEHWERAAHHRFIGYEALIRDPAAVLGAVLEFLGLPMHPDCSAAIQESQEFFRRSATSASPEASLDRWKNELSAEEIATIEEICGPLMQRHGFPIIG